MESRLLGVVDTSVFAEKMPNLDNASFVWEPMCIKPVVKQLHNFSFLQPIVNISPVLRIAGLGNFYDTRRCNKAYPVSFGDRLSFSQESGLDV